MPQETVSDFSLQLNTWLLKNRDQVRKWWVILILGIDVFLLAAVLTQGVLFLFRFHDGGNTADTVAVQTQQLAGSIAKFAPTPLVQSEVVTTLHAKDRFDFSLRLENPNIYWQAKTTITFSGGSKDLPPVTVIIPPKTIRYAMALDIPPQTIGSVAQGVIKTQTTEWERMFVDDSINLPLTITNLTQTQVTLTSGENQQQQVTQVTANANNKSLLSITGLRIAIVLFRDTTPIGVQNTIVSIKSESTLPISVEWGTVLPVATSIVAFPELHSGILSTK
jgi:hypothetical protein